MKTECKTLLFRRRALCTGATGTMVPTRILKARDHTVMSQSEMELDDALADHAGPALVHVDASRAIELPFEAWHFRRSATLHALVLGSMTALWIALPIISNGWQNLDLLSILCILMAIGMIAGRAAAHAWLEPVFAQKLVARLAFGGMCTIMALQFASLSQLTTAAAQGDLSMGMIII